MLKAAITIRIARFAIRFDPHYWISRILSTRNKRWNGNLDTLAVDYIDEIIERMVAYGNQVQFDLPGKGQRPNYQVMGNSGRKMAFDSKNLLMRPNENGDVSDNLSAIFTLDQIKAAKAYSGIKRTKPRAPRTTTASSAGGAVASRSAAPAAVPVDTIDAEKYQYFKNNRDTLPEGIQKHSATISDLMRTGLSAEAAFGEIIKQHY
ncbi:MAG TPA: hypothetical protein VIP51_09170 [Eoetvoesiella sp.]